MKNVILFSTLGCHLCEQAKSLVWPIASGLNYQVKEIDIAESEELVERYGICIPVLALFDDLSNNDLSGNDLPDNRAQFIDLELDKAKELFWPFDADQIFAFISN